MIIFGIDPGTATTGYGVVREVKSLKSKVKSRLELVEYGCVVTPKEMEMPSRLYSIQKDLHKLLKQHKPDCISIEQLFFGVNSRTAMTVGQARGVVLSTVASYGLPIFEYQGLHVKSVITGSGKADKKDIQKYVMRYLNKRKLAKPTSGYIDDAADALAVAICHWIKVSQIEIPKVAIIGHNASVKGANGRTRLTSANKGKKNIKRVNGKSSKKIGKARNAKQAVVVV